MEIRSQSAREVYALGLRGKENKVLPSLKHSHLTAFLNRKKGLAHFQAGRHAFCLLLRKKDTVKGTPFFPPSPPSSIPLPSASSVWERGPFDLILLDPAPQPRCTNLLIKGCSHVVLIDWCTVRVRLCKSECTDRWIDRPTVHLRLKKNKHHHHKPPSAALICHHSYLRPLGYAPVLPWGHHLGPAQMLSGSQSVFQFIPSVFDAVDVGAQVQTSSGETFSVSDQALCFGTVSFSTGKRTKTQLSPQSWERSTERGWLICSYRGQKRMTWLWWDLAWVCRGMPYILRQALNIVGRLPVHHFFCQVIISGRVIYGFCDNSMNWQQGSQMLLRA